MMTRVALLFLFTATVAATSCEPTFDNCTAGCWSDEVLSNGVRICAPVGEGYYSPHNDNNRYGCVGGTFSDTEEAERCSICKAGSISPPRKAECFLCPRGSYQNNPGQSICMSCNYSDGGYDGYGSNAITPEGLCRLIDVFPSAVPSQFPTSEASSLPTHASSTSPSESPSTAAPSHEPTYMPSSNPTLKPSAMPSPIPTYRPSSYPIFTPSETPSIVPTASPTFNPTAKPSTLPSNFPSNAPSIDPTLVPSEAPSNIPSNVPSKDPTFVPSKAPSTSPTTNPKPKKFMFWGEQSASGIIFITVFFFLLLVLTIVITAGCCYVICFAMRSHEESVEIISDEEGKPSEIPVATAIDEVIEVELDKEIKKQDEIV